jgi:hypothetical protein
VTLRFAVALVAAVACWSIAHHTSDQRTWMTDTGLYEQYGDATVHGNLPYRDFQLEYPPGALPVLIVPSLVREDDPLGYDRWFDREMLVCWCLVLLGVALIARSTLPLAVVAATPVLLGPVMFSRFDSWPTALAVLALAAFVRSWLPASAVLLGAAIAAKLWPFVLLPLFVARLGWQRGARFAAGALAAAAAVFVPFLVLAPGGVWHSFHQQLFRPLQIESLGGAVLIAAHHVFGLKVHVVSTYGSQNVAGTLAHVMQTVLTVALVISLLLIWILGRDLIKSSAGCVAALLAFGKVFSPQFMVWLVPFAALVPGLAAPALLVASLLLTQTWFPRYYWDYANSLYRRQVAEVLARDVVVVALFALTAWRSRMASARLPGLRSPAR